MTEETISGTPMQSSEEKKLKEEVSKGGANMKLQEDIKARCDLVNWVIAISQKYNLSSAIMVQVIILFDKNVNKKVPSRDLTVLACFILVVESLLPLTPFQVVQICRNRFSYDEITKAKLEIKSVMKQEDIDNPIEMSNQFCDYLLKGGFFNSFISDVVKKMSSLFVLLVSFNPNFSAFNRKLLAICSVILFTRDFLPRCDFKPESVFGNEYTDKIIEDSLNTFKRDLKNNLVSYRRFQSFDIIYKETEQYLKLN
ncbi:hypothetical protein EIN_087160 [Entamoeba invadens IP1]|uniref:hypothetical protein n=1 Tax=Entamoeba invadens IP1 TaxID=370355 RepID=UPI0002C3F013|nr:hypothetical protein EIN_087160 [Entamoeba invadens IP1]ELP85414.1 hypothetical protein EIN_087160 [Entamoeba invadens IP1]|eukprot:XP_004184760.1 hypothetical protein EIN_087160 [Entamoeba invadens IP1]